MLMEWTLSLYCRMCGRCRCSVGWNGCGCLGWHIRLPHEMGLERRVTLLLPPLVPSYPPPKMSFSGLALRLQLHQECLKKIPETRSHPDSVLHRFGPRFRSKCGAKIAPKPVPNSNLFQDVLNQIFASKTKDQCIFEKTKILENAWTVVQKSTLWISELAVKYHLKSVWI